MEAILAREATPPTSPLRPLDNKSTIRKPDISIHQFDSGLDNRIDNNIGNKNKKVFVESEGDMSEEAILEREIETGQYDEIHNKIDSLTKEIKELKQEKGENKSIYAKSGYDILSPTTWTMPNTRPPLCIVDKQDQCPVCPTYSVNKPYGTYMSSNKWTKDEGSNYDKSGY